jgi:hypothetical protein
MKTRAQILLMGLFSIVPLFPKESGARFFAARLIGVKEEALPQVQLSDPQDSSSPIKKMSLDHFNRGVTLSRTGGQ